VGRRASQRLKVVITRSARRDITSIWRFIARDSVRHADLVEDAIVATCYSVASLPVVGHRRTDLTRRDILFAPVHGYDKYQICICREL
jgi:plasmid stabilization system protein ParE